MQDANERKVTQESICLPEEKQRELYEIIKQAFSEELKYMNCFILSEVGNRTGEILKSKGFDKANRQVFLSASNYFLVGYNEKNIASIALQGYESDSNFYLTKRNVNEEREVVLTKDGVFPEKIQKEMLLLVESLCAKELRKRNCLLLSNVSKKLVGVFQKKGLGKPNKQTFDKAPLYFESGFNEKNGACIMLLNRPADPFFTKKPKIKNANIETEFIDRLYKNLKMNYKTLDVSEKNIKKYITQNKLVLPKEVENLEKLFEILFEKYGSIVRSDGEDMPEEKFLVLRTPLPIPNTIKDTVENIVEQYFFAKDIVSNMELGQALKNNGIDYKAYDYPDLTGFLRSCTDLFSIVPVVDLDTQKTQIYVRIKHNKNFEEKLNKAIEINDSSYILDSSVLHAVLIRNNAELWEKVLIAISRIENSKFKPIEHISEWEKLVITKDDSLNEVINDVDFMTNNGVSEKQRLIARNNIDKDTSETWNFSSIGLRIEAMCGKDSGLPGYFYLMGLFAGDNLDKNFCFINYSVWCAKYYPEYFADIWNEHKDARVSNASMLIIIGTLFTEKCFSTLMYAYENMPCKVTKTNALDVYYAYAKAIHEQNIDSNLPNLNCIEMVRRADILTSYLESVEAQENIDGYCDLLYKCITDPENYLNIGYLEEYLVNHTTFIKKHYNTIINKAKTGDYRYWLIVEHFCKDDPNDEYGWKNYKNEYRNSLVKKIANSGSIDEKEKLIKEALLFFPNDNAFSEDSYEYISVRISEATNEEIKEICTRLLAVGNYSTIISIYEEKIIEHSELWFLNYVSQSYIAMGKIEKAILTKLQEVIAQKEMNISENQSAIQLCEILYRSALHGEIRIINKENAVLVLDELRDFKPDFYEIAVYEFALIILAINAEYTGLYSLLFALADENIKQESVVFFNKVKQYIIESNEGYEYYVDDFAKSYEYFLTTENIDTITYYVKCLSNILKFDGFEREYQKYWGVDANIIDTNAFSKLLIVDFEEEKSWRLLSKYSNECGKYALNYAANFMWLFKFNDKGHALKNCIRAMDKWVDDSLPKNYLINNVYLLRSRLRIDGYWQTFYQHIVENNSFENKSESVVDTYLNVLLSRPNMSEMECMLVIAILSQINDAKVYYRRLFVDNSVFLKVIKRNVKCYVRLFTLMVCNHEYSGEVNEQLNLLRNQVYTRDISDKDRSAIQWLNYLFDLKYNGKLDDEFMDTSRVLLLNYPSGPSNSVVDDLILLKNPEDRINCNLISYWINTFDNIYIVTKAYIYLLRRKRSNDLAERIEEYRLMLMLTRKIIIYYEGVLSKQIPDYIRICKTYQAIKAILCDQSIESDAFMQKLQSGFKNIQESNVYYSYCNKLSDFSKKDIPTYLREGVLYCGITNYWDIFLQNLLDKTDELGMYIQDINAYISVLDQRPLKRRLLQMYLYVNVANKLLKCVPSERIDKIRAKEVFLYKSAIETGELLVNPYIAELRILAKLLCPRIEQFFEEISKIVDEKQQAEALYVIYFVLFHKKWNDLAEKLVTERFEFIDEVLVPCVEIIHTKKEIENIIEFLAYNGQSIVTSFLKNDTVTTLIGPFLTGFYYAIYEVKNGKYELAQKHLRLVGECPQFMSDQFDNVVRAVSNRTDIEYNAEKSQDEAQIIQLSFMREKEAEGQSYSQLVMEFETKHGLHDATEKCLIAQRIYYYLLNGASMSDIYNFVFQWGFYAIEAEFDIERKSNILFELLDNIHSLQDPILFKEQFVMQFTYILNECEFHIFVKNFSKIYEHFKRLYAEYHPFEDSLCIAELMVQLSRLMSLVENNADTSKVISHIDDIQKEIIGVHAKYPQNYFASRSMEFVDLFKYQLFEKGIFEVRILNEDKLYDGTIFYQIKNLGFETIFDISITLYLDGIDGTINYVKISDEIKGGLRPNHVYAGEYSPNVDIPDGKEIVCILQLEYAGKSYIAVDATSGGALISKKKNYEYHKSAFSGYLESTIDSDDQANFIGRKTEIEEIIGSISKRENVLLFGTNGTGKSSILNSLSSKHIPKLCEMNEKLAISINIIADDECTETQVVNVLLDKICRDNCMLLHELRKIERHHKEIDLIDCYEELNDIIERRKQMTIVDETGIYSSDIIELFTGISRALKSAGIQLFLLWDNFEKVIESSNINPKHMRFLRTLDEIPNAMSNILFVFSGSNYLLEAVSIEGGDDSWNEILTRCSKAIKIGNLCYDDFCELMSQRRALNDGEIHYSEAALDYLWNYTNGHAFYSCLIGNKTLEILSSRQVKRRCVYPSDIFVAIYKSDKYVCEEGSNTSKETAIEKQIFQDISNNIAVKYVGRKLAEHIFKGAMKVSNLKLQEIVLKTRPDISEYDFKMAVDILRARDFIQKIEISSSNQDGTSGTAVIEYSFTSDLYLERFVNIFIPELTQKVTDEIERKKRDIYDMLRDATDDDIERLKKIIGTNIRGQNVFEHGSTQNNTNIQVNVQSITNTLNGILAAGDDQVKLLSGLRKLPRLDAYLPISGNDNESEILSDERLSLAIDSYVADMEEGLKTSYAKIDDSKKDVSYSHILNLSEKEYEEFIMQYDVPEYFLNSLKFAYQLDQLFSNERIKKDIDTVDYSPVTIMYCKLIEGLLKEYHINPYSNCLRKVKTKLNKPNSSHRYLWGEIADLPQQQKQLLTIGSFAFPLENFEWALKEMAKYSKCDVKEWELHKEMIIAVRDIRNPSAHGNKNHRISYEQKNRISSLLLEKRGLLRLIKIVS